jgi:hypothetical protein
MDPYLFDPFFAAIEQSPPSIFMREDFYAYFVVLIFHSIGMGLFVGGGGIICLRAAGFPKEASLDKFRGFLSAMWTGLVLAIVSGIGLLIAYPAKALTNPLFLFKYLFLGGAGWILWRIVKYAFPAAERDEPLPRPTRLLAAAALALFVLGIGCGKLLLYTYTVLTVS